MSNIGDLVPGGLILLHSCNTCLYGRKPWLAGIYCAIDSEPPEGHGDDWRIWSYRHATAENGWCPNHAPMSDISIKFNRRKAPEDA